jgi:uncharacterized membrane protein YphA (DoxX/SURF4 family)
MKTINIIYWVSTILLALLMLSSAIPSIMNGPDSVKFMAHLGYASYVSPYLGVLKILGVIAIIVPGFPRIREWAYAGFTFDLMGALYSFIVTHEPWKNLVLFPVFFAILIVSYIYWHKKLKATRHTDAVV